MLMSEYIAFDVAIATLRIITSISGVMSLPVVTGY